MAAATLPVQFGRYRYWLGEREPLLWPGERASEAEKQAWRDRSYAHANRLPGQAGTP